MERLERLKLLEAIVFFVKNTKACGLVKLFKLLYYLDMLHFREVGRSVTGLRYEALPYGPVPTDLYDEVRHPRPDMASTFSIERPPTTALVSSIAPRTVFSVLKPLGTSHLTKRELRIIGEVAEIFRDVTAEQISDISHKRNGPWDLAKRAGEGKWGTEIDYFHSINLDFGTGKAATIEELRDRAEEYDETRKTFA